MGGLTKLAFGRVFQLWNSRGWNQMAYQVITFPMEHQRWVMWIALCALTLATAIGLCVVAIIAPKDRTTFGRTSRR
jgi:hypothetical protein